MGREPQVVDDAWLFHCVHCDSQGHGITFARDDEYDRQKIALCPGCGFATNLRRLGATTQWIPVHELPRPGRAIAYLSPEIELLYNEVRVCLAAEALTAAVLVGRTLLMHVAVEDGAKPDLSYAAYVKYLEAQNLVPKNAGGWVDRIRTFGNHGAHEIVPTTHKDAAAMLHFVQLLLANIYEASGVLDSLTPT